MSQDTITLAVTDRDVLGKSVKHLRTEGTVPAVIHDHGKPSLVVQGNGVAMLKVWKQAGKHHPVQLETNGKKMTAIIKVAEFDPKKHLLTHMVFNAVSATEMVDAEIPVHARYAEGNDSSPAERAGLLVLSQLDAVAVKATASNLPDELFYDAEKLIAVGDHLLVSDIIAPSGVEIVTDQTHPLATVFEPSAMAAANDAAGGDAQADDAKEVDADHESGTIPNDQAAEDQPGGQKQREAQGE